MSQKITFVRVAEIPLGTDHAVMSRTVDRTARSPGSDNFSFAGQGSVTFSNSDSSELVTWKPRQYTPLKKNSD